MTTEQFDFDGTNGQKLSGRLDLPDGPVQAFALFAHCFTCSKNSVAATRVARALTGKGYGVLRFDFTGLGQSGGSFADSTFSGNVGDVVAAAQAMAASGRTPRLLVGHSLGGAAVLAAALDLPEIAAVSTIGAPFDVQHVQHLLGNGVEALQRDGEAEVTIGGRPFRIRRSFIDDLAAHDQGDRIGHLRRALLILHSPQDAIVGIDNASAIFLSAKHPKSFVSLDGADHLLTRTQDAEYVAEIVSAWASRYVQPGAPLRSEDQDGPVVVEETGVGKFQVEVQAGGARFLADEPMEVGGLGSGATPYDLLCAALGTCKAMTMRLYADGKGWALGRIRVAVAHSRRADQTPPDLFTCEIQLPGSLDDHQRARLIEIAERCPVHRTLTNGAQIKTVEADRPHDTMRADSPILHAADAQRLSNEIG